MTATNDAKQEEALVEVEEPPANAPTARRDFGLLWAGQSVSLFGDQFMTLALPLLAVTALGASPAQAALLKFALFLPFLLLGLQAGAIVDRLPRLATMIGANALQLVAFGAIWLLAALHSLSFVTLLILITLSGCAVVFFQVAYTSYLPNLYRHPKDLHRGNARLALSESTSQALGPMAAGPVIALLGVVLGIAADTVGFAVSVLTLLLIKHREPPRERTVRERGWMRKSVGEGLRFVIRHPVLQPIMTCGATYTFFLTMVMTSLVLYCRNELGLSPQWIGVVVGAAAAGYPIGNVISAKLGERIGYEKALAVSAAISVAGIVSMPALGSIGGVAGVCGLIFGSIFHCVGEGSYSPTSLTLRQLIAPPEMLARVGSVQRFLIWGMISLGSLAASIATALVGLTGAMWIGALGTVLCLPALLRKGMRTAVFSTVVPKENNAVRAGN
ncbi:MFS transporter [Saccharothrix sp. ST-888]|uniref:MFS transporter n=1 Tax=Saccharothrix sp. ST-888 TaxID=1427391 RepID=UPI00069699D4|nr:MFS transporter [Saccharothrix sp. ST-888]